MTNYIHTCEGSDATPVTNANAPVGSNNWSVVEKGANATIEYDSAKFSSGLTSIKYSGTVATDSRASARWTFSAPTNAVALRCYFYINPFFTGSTQTLFALQTSGSVSVAVCSLYSDGRISIKDFTGAEVQSTGTLAADTWYRIEMIMNDLTTTKELVLNVYAGHATTPLPGLSLIDNDPDFGTAGVDRAMFGKYSTNSIATYWLDDIVVVTDSTTPIGPNQGSVPHYDLTANHPTDSTVIESWTLDSTTSIGVTSLTQTSGTTATVVQSPTGVFTITNPAGTDPLAFTLSSVYGGVTATKNLVISRGTVVGGKKAYWIFQGGTATDINNWD